MSSRSRIAVAALMSTGLMTGSVHADLPRGTGPDLRQPPGSGVRPAVFRTMSSPAPAPGTPESDRGAIRLVAAEGHAAPIPPPANLGVPIDIDQCRRQAAQQAVPVRLIAQELQWVEFTAHRAWCGDPHAFAVHRQVLLCRAEVCRNEAAAAALELLFRLSEAEQLAVLVRLAIPQFDQARKDMRTLRAQGLVGIQDTTELDRYRLQLDENQLLLDESVVRAGTQLRSLLGMDPVHGPPLHPVVDVAPGTVPLDVEPAIARGLTMRPDLSMLRMLIHELDPKTLPFASGALQLVDSSLGQPPAGAHSLSILKAPCDQTTVEVRRSQLMQLLQDREGARAAEIRRAVESVKTAIAQMRLAEQTIGTWQERLKDLDQRMKEGTATPLDITTSKLRLLEARTNLVKHTTEARIAEIRLLEAEGILATGCE